MQTARHTEMLVPEKIAIGMDIQNKIKQQNTKVCLSHLSTLKNIRYIADSNKTKAQQVNILSSNAVCPSVEFSSSISNGRKFFLLY
jgi:hypothetical protein